MVQHQPTEWVLGCIPSTQSTQRSWACRRCMPIAKSFVLCTLPLPSGSIRVEQKQNRVPLCHLCDTVCTSGVDSAPFSVETAIQPGSYVDQTSVEGSWHCSPHSTHCARTSEPDRTIDHYVHEAGWMCTRTTEFRVTQHTFTATPIFGTALEVVVHNHLFQKIKLQFV